MAYQLINGRFQAFTDAGAFAVGYQLYTYDSGTTTPKATYTDATLASVNTNPVVLNGRGEAQVWLGSGAYTLVLKDASGVTVWTVDGVVDVQSATQAALDAGFSDLSTTGPSKGASLVGYAYNSVSAASRTVLDKLSEAISVDDFGAVVDSESSAAVNASAFANAIAVGAISSKHVICGYGKTYYLPSGTTIGQAGVTLDGRGAKLMQPSGSQTGNWLSITGANGFKLKNFDIDGNRANAASLSADSSLLVVYNVEDVELFNLAIHGSSAKGLSITSGVSGTGTRRISAVAITSYDCKVQCVMTDRSNGGSDSPACEDVTLDRITVKDTDHAGVAINDGSRRVTLINSFIDVNNSVWDAVSVRGSREVKISNTTGRRGRNGCQISVLDAAAITRGEDARNITLTGNHWEYNNQNGCLIAGGIGVNVLGDISRNNGQTSTAYGFNVTQVPGVRRASRVNLIGVQAVDDQTSPTQSRAIVISASDHVRVRDPQMFGNVTDNRVVLVPGVTDARVHGDGDDGSTLKRVSGSTGSIAANTTAVVTLNFATGFDSTPTRAMPSVLVGSSTPYLQVVQIVALTTAAVQVMVKNINGSSAVSGTLFVDVELTN